MSKKEMVAQMFNDISGQYDFLNHFLSFGVDYRWRRKFVSLLEKHKPATILDVATGTGDLAFAMTVLKPEKISGIDIAEQMLEIARKKADRLPEGTKIRFLKGDAEKIPFSDNSFDAVTVAFGVRNYENLEKGLMEMKRVLKPGGIMMILEFSHPGKTPFKQFYRLYSRYGIPVIGKIFSGNKQAYRYLPESVAAFPSGTDFLAILEKSGMKTTFQQPLTFGIATIYSGIK
jgi:demethylmenaquinone methyltransferase / 2-methoxy-6-polyprenyl-1,4-benzoquinol methylase